MPCFFNTKTGNKMSPLIKREANASKSYS
jgi:hypothetical protein